MELLSSLSLSLALTLAPPSDYSPARPFDGAVIVAQSWSCQPRKTCSRISSCEEARWYLANCDWGYKLDGDNAGNPCEDLCGQDN